MQSAQPVIVSSTPIVGVRPVIVSSATPVVSSTGVRPVVVSSATPITTTTTTTVVKPPSRTLYVVIAIIFVVIIVLWIIVLLIMFFSSSGLFAENYTRPPPADSGLIPVNGQQVTLTAAEKATLKLKVDEALANIAAKNAA
jgi:Na+/melibiose symporter-like transporter